MFNLLYNDENINVLDKGVFLVYLNCEEWYDIILYVVMWVVIIEGMNVIIVCCVVSEVGVVVG